jgi:hypothetical protein
LGGGVIVVIKIYYKKGGFAKHSRGTRSAAYGGSSVPYKIEILFLD